MKHIRKLVHRITTQYATRSPFQICKNLKINILFVDLPDDVEGLFVNFSENGFKSILISKYLSQCEREKVCAHELGHALLHSEINSILYEDDQTFCLAKFEMEADLFSNLLLQEPDGNLEKDVNSLTKLKYNK